MVRCRYGDSSRPRSCRYHAFWRWFRQELRQLLWHILTNVLLSANRMGTSRHAAFLLSCAAISGHDFDSSSDSVSRSVCDFYPDSDSLINRQVSLEDASRSGRELRLFSPLISGYDSDLYSHCNSDSVSVFGLCMYRFVIQDLINRQGNLDEASIASIALDMAQGLHYMHSLNMLHRDIKPANILLDREVTTCTAPAAVVANEQL